MEVILAAAGFPLPCGAAEDGEPIIGWGSVGLGICPDIPICFIIGVVLAAFFEPFMFI